MRNMIPHDDRASSRSRLGCVLALISVIHQLLFTGIVVHNISSVSVADAKDVISRPKRPVNDRVFYLTRHEKDIPAPLLIVWDPVKNMFVEYVVERGVYDKMKQDGRIKANKDIVLLLHGWHAYQSSMHIFEPLLRMHQKVTPNTTVILVNWEGHGANYLELRNAAFAAVRIDLGPFLKEIPVDFRLHCVGHSLGGHGCSAICRQYRFVSGNLCTRIVSLDPASVMFKSNSPDPDVKNYRVAAGDARYTAVLMTNRNFMGLSEHVGDEYLMTNYFGWSSEACPAIGKWSGYICVTAVFGKRFCEYMDVKTMFNSAVVPHVKDSCSHMMAPITFMKLLDVESPIPVISLQENAAVSDAELFPSVWNSYTCSRDYRYDTAFSSTTIPYSFTVHSGDLRAPSLLIIVTKRERGKNALGIEGIGKSYIYSRHSGAYMEWYTMVFDRFSPGHVFKVYSGTNVIMMKIRKAVGYGTAKWPGEGATPMTGWRERKVSCTSMKGYYYNYQCSVDSFPEIRTQVYRTQLQITDTPPVEVPPVLSCLPYNYTNSGRIHFTRQIIGKVDVFMKVPITPPFTKELLAVAIQNGTTTETLVSFWDSCGASEKYGLSITYNRLRRDLQIKSSKPQTVKILLVYDLFLFKYTLVVKPATSGA